MPGRNTFRLFLTVILALSQARDSLGEFQWSRWRGPTENGHVAITDVPVRWSAKDIVWKAKLDGRGQSSPILWNDQIFLTAAKENGRDLSLLVSSDGRQTFDS
jgi:outer membrane protein assembly factor BamB